MTYKVQININGFKGYVTLVIGIQNKIFTSILKTAYRAKNLNLTGKGISLKSTAFIWK